MQPTKAEPASAGFSGNMASAIARATSHIVSIGPRDE
jgi:hypothetical protein